MGFCRRTVLGVLVAVAWALGTSCVFADSLKCLTCHSAPGFRKVVAGKAKSLFIDTNEVAQSVHAKRDCLDCHRDFIGQKFPHKQTADPVNCSVCHYKGNGVGAPDKSHVESYRDSVHGSAMAKGDKDAPRCSNCHGTHGIRKNNDPKALDYQANIPTTCGKCHFDPELAKRHGISDVSRYQKSVHATIIRKDRLVMSAVCTDCHGVHDIRAPGDKASKVDKPHIPATCGKCHGAIYKQYESSIHGTAVAKGVKEAPVCTNCHGEHGIQATSATSSSVYPTHVAATCGKCHENVGIQKKYGLPANRLASYVGSYHGIASRFGDLTVANCATCHGAHRILPSSDPKSPINKKNLPETCGKCHPGAGENFAKGTIHVFPTMKQDAVAYWVRLGYRIFIVLLIGSFVGLIVLDVIARIMGRLPGRKRGKS